MRTHFSNIEYAVSSENALEGASACVISTDWDEFAVLDILPALKREDSSVGVRLPIHGGNLRVCAHFFGTFVGV